MTAQSCSGNSTAVCLPVKLYTGTAITGLQKTDSLAFATSFREARSEPNGAKYFVSLAQSAHHVVPMEMCLTEMLRRTVALFRRVLTQSYIIQDILLL